MRFYCNCFKCLVEASSDNSSLTCGCVPFPLSQVAEANVASNERAKRSKKKKKWRMDQGRFLLDSTPSRIYPFSHYICFLLFVFCPIGFSIPGFPKKIEIPRQGEGRVGLTVGFTFSWKAILLSKEMASVDLELSSFSLLKGIDFLCKCYSSFCVLADLKTHFKITERT